LFAYRKRADHLTSKLLERIMYRALPWSSGAKADIVDELTDTDQRGDHR
jgi:hypothetical protein